MADSQDESCHSEDQATSPKGLFPVGEAMCQCTAFEFAAWSWKSGQKGTVLMRQWGQRMERGN